jgi:hypothetical protein
VPLHHETKIENNLLLFVLGTPAALACGLGGAVYENKHSPNVEPTYIVCAPK